MTDNGQQTTTTTQDTTGAATGQTGGERPETLSLTTAQLNERLERAQRSTLTKLFEALGVTDVDALKGVIAEHKTLKSASQTEAEKLASAATEAQAKLTTEATARKAAEDRVKELEAARITDKVDSAITSAAQSAGANNSAHVLKLLRDEKADKVTTLANDKGEVDAKSAETLVNEFKTANPTYFKGGGPGSPPNRGGKTPEPDKDAKDKARQDFRSKIRRMG